VKGALISLAIGLVVYLAVVRGLLMRKVERGIRSYVNVLPARLDMEDSLYRPAISLLTSHGTLLARFLEKITLSASPAVSIVPEADDAHTLDVN
jgi:hypothetical protein